MAAKKKAAKKAAPKAARSAVKAATKPAHKSEATVAKPPFDKILIANRGFIDDVIMPHGTRRRVCRALATLETKKLENPWRKHGNIPL